MFCEAKVIFAIPMLSCFFLSSKIEKKTISHKMYLFNIYAPAIRFTNYM